LAAVTPHSRAGEPAALTPAQARLRKMVLDVPSWKRETLRLRGKCLIPMRNGRHLGHWGSLARIAKKLRTTPNSSEKLRQITLKVTLWPMGNPDELFPPPPPIALPPPVIALPPVALAPPRPPARGFHRRCPCRRSLAHRRSELPPSAPNKRRPCGHQAPSSAPPSPTTGPR
jgi:hypothetical protein